jgi:hypothetical protein
MSFPATSLAVTYYPSAISRRSATPVKVASGGEASGVDITLITDRPAHKISGVVSSARDGQPLEGVSVSITPGDGTEMTLGPMLEGRTVQTDSEGRWTIKGVPDGEYVLEVTPMVYRSGLRGGRPPFGGGGQRIPLPGGTTGGTRLPLPIEPPPFAARRIMPKKQEVIVAGADVSGLAVSVSEGGRVQGVVTTEDGSPVPDGTLIIQLPQTANANRASASTTAQTAASTEPPMIEGPRPRQIPRPTPVRPDGTFAVNIVPFVKVRLKVEVPGEKFYVKSMMLDGVDLLSESREFDGETDVKGLRIVLATDTATLAGRVKQALDGAGAVGLHVVLVPVEAERRAGNHLFGMTGADGAFKISGPPGDYFVYVIPPGAQPLPLRDEANGATPARALRITLQPNERKEMELTTLK